MSRLMVWVFVLGVACAVVGCSDDGAAPSPPESEECVVGEDECCICSDDNGAACEQGSEGCACVLEEACSGGIGRGDAGGGGGSDAALDVADDVAPDTGDASGDDAALTDVALDAQDDAGEDVDPSDAIEDVRDDAEDAGADVAPDVAPDVPVGPLAVTINASVTSGALPLRVELSASVQGGAPPVMFAWDFGDGATSDEDAPIHTFRDPEAFTVTLTVTDEDGETAQDQLTITPACVANVMSGSYSGDGSDLVGVTRVTSRLELTGSPRDGLRDLACLEETREFTVSGVSGVTSFEGLAALRSVETFTITDNPDLERIGSLPGLEYLRQLNVARNPALTELGPIALPDFMELLWVSNNAALVGLGVVEGPELLADLLIVGNASLTSLEGLEAVRDAFVTIDDNAALEDLRGLSGLTSASFLSISNNANLTSLDGLSALTFTGEILEISSNPSLVDLSGMSALTQINGRLTIVNNASLVSTAGPTATVDSPGTVTIVNNPQLTDLAILTGCERVRGSLIVRDNASLVSLAGAESVASVGSWLEVINNDSLRSFEGLGALVRIEALDVRDNDALESMDGLTSLVEIEARTVAGVGVEISGNAVLGDIEQLRTVDGDLWSRDDEDHKPIIRDNPTLCRAFVDEVLEDWSAEAGFDVADASKLTGNDGVCVDACRLVPPEEIVTLAGDSVRVFGRVREAGLTDTSAATDPSPELTAELGYGPEGSNPKRNSAWTWVGATANAGYDEGSPDGEVGEDEYQARFDAPAPAVYDFVYRFSLDGGASWRYCTFFGAPVDAPWEHAGTLEVLDL